MAGERGDARGEGSATADREAPGAVVVETAAVTDLQPIQTVEATVSEELKKGARVHVNVRQDVLVVPADRVRLCLREYHDELRARASWQAPAGILASLVAALVAADFKDNLGLSASTWEALFILAGIGCLALLIRGLFRAFRSRARGDDVEVLVARLRQ